MKGRSFLTLKDFTTEEILALLQLSIDLKAKKKGQGCPSKLEGKLLADKNIVLIFDKSSTRTRCSFEVGPLMKGRRSPFSPTAKWERKNRLRIRPKYWVGCTMVFNTGGSHPRSSVKLQSTAVFRYGTALLMTTIQPRFLPMS